jgi:hypothetical protein
MGQEIAMASKPVDIEINLMDKPKFSVSTDAYLAPHGPNAKLKKAMIVSNPKVDTKVEKVFSDTDLKAKDAMLYLYKIILMKITYQDAFCRNIWNKKRQKIGSNKMGDHCI